jgi:hypothetical protein
MTIGALSYWFHYVNYTCAMAYCASKPATGINPGSLAEGTSPNRLLNSNLAFTATHLAGSKR